MKGSGRLQQKLTGIHNEKIVVMLEKYRMDEEFVSHMKSVTGAPFLHEAVPVDKKEWNPLMATSMSWRYP